jgi:hypothetical protein
MKILAPRVLRALERFNGAYPWDHNAHCHRWILRQLPRHFERTLGVGSGSGDLARLLAGRADAVKAVDLYLIALVEDALRLQRCLAPSPHGVLIRDRHHAADRIPLTASAAPC